MSDDCLFCKIIAGQIPSNKVYSDEQMIAFRDINPTAPQHILLVPRKHIVDIAHATREDQALLGDLLLRANVIAANEGLAESGFRIVINTGSDAGRTIFHLHVHVLGGRPLGALG